MIFDFLVVGKFAGLQFGINQFSVDADFEAAAIGRHQRQFFQAGFEFGDEFVGQTDRFGFVVSGLTVNDFDFHYLLSLVPSHEFFN